jgi:hypothetical protein
VFRALMPGVVALCLIPLVGAPEALANEAADLQRFIADRAPRGRELADAAAACVRRRDTAHAVFHGCIDWHSAVHGTWALVAASEITGDSRYLDEARRLLDPIALERERKDLKARPEFELPYGRAWFLRLAADFERLASDRRLRAMADEVAASLAREYLHDPIDPASSSYSSETWTFINLLYYAEFAGNTDLVRAVRVRIAKDLSSARSPCSLLETELESGDFMALCTNWAWLVAQNMPAARFQPWIRAFLPHPAVALPPVRAPRGSHEFGANFSRAWGLWEIYRGTGNREFLGSYLAHFEAGYQAWRQMKTDYGRVGHWVAQFGMLALQRSLQHAQPGVGKSPTSR